MRGASLFDLIALLALASFIGFLAYAAMRRDEFEDRCTKAEGVPVNGSWCIKIPTIEVKEKAKP